MQKRKLQTTNKQAAKGLLIFLVFSAIYLVLLVGCSHGTLVPPAKPEGVTISDTMAPVQEEQTDTETSHTSSQPVQGPNLDELRVQLNLIEDYRPSFAHGHKGPEHQKYIVLHDTEGDALPRSVIDWWESNGNLIAAHFIIGIDGSVIQCVPMDMIAHHAGFGNAGHNNYFDVTDESR